jgi:hypothetical protein
MRTFALQAGCQMRITASMEKGRLVRHRWSVALFTASGLVGSADPCASYGSRIGSGETQRIDAAAVKRDCICEVASTHETGDCWQADLDQVTVDAPDALAIRFHAPASGGGAAAEECVLTFEFSPRRGVGVEGISDPTTA